MKKRLLLFFSHFKSQKGFSLFEVVIALTLIVILGAVVQLNYRSYKHSVIKDMHVLNTVQYITSLQNSVLKGYVNSPEEGQRITVDLGELISFDSTVDLSDPSDSNGQEYDRASYIQLYNNNGTMEYYINLKRYSENHTYINTTTSQSSLLRVKLNHEIAPQDISLPE